MAKVLAEFVGHDRTVECEPGETLLHAGLRAGLSVPYECASGGCGSCRGQLIDGEVRSLWPDATGLSERDRRRGNRILCCQSIPVTDCRVKVPQFTETSALPEPAPQRVTAVLARREMVTSDAAIFALTFQTPMDYLPGQFMILESEDGIRRAYSMAHPATPAGSTDVEFIIRAKPGGAGSQWLFENVEPGAELIVEGPYGRAYARHDSDRPVLCIAGGTGLAPVLAIADRLLERQNRPPMDFYFGVRRTCDLVATDRIAGLGSAGARVFISVQDDSGDGAESDAGTGVDMSFRTGLVIDHVAEDWDDLSGHDIYLAGPAGMVDAALRALVRERNASADHVFFDRFIT